jgi:hypothetical protein
MTVWYYLRVAPGDLRPLSPSDMESFLRAEQPLPADEDRHVHYVGLEVSKQEDTILDLGHVWFGRCRVKEDGLLDQQAMLAQANARLAAQDRLRDGLPADEVLIDARDVFEARRLLHATRWQPTEIDLRTLQSLVNERAGWNIL